MSGQAVSPLPSTGRSPPFATLVTQWFQHRSRSGRWCAEVEANVKRFVRYWKKAWKGRPVAEISSMDVMEYEVARAEKVYESCLNQERTFLKQFIRWAIAERFIERDPTTNWAHRREIVRRAYRPLSHGEEATFLSFAPDWLGRLVVFAIQTGLRQGTIRKLRWSMLQVTVRDGKEIWTFVIPADCMKARKPHRVVLTEKARVVLAAPGEGDALVFDKMPGKVCISRHVRLAAAAAGVQGFTFHDTRRTFAMRLSMAGVPMNLIMKLGHWHRPNTMLNNYCDLSDQNALEALGRIG